MSSSIVTISSTWDLTEARVERILKEIKQRLQGRVQASYVFGSASTGLFHKDSDIDLILVVERPREHFVQRAFDFLDLREVHPRLDVLVYTQDELDRQLADANVGFWKSVKATMREI